MSAKTRIFSLHARGKPLPKGARLISDLSVGPHGKYAVLIEHKGKKK